MKKEVLLRIDTKVLYTDGTYQTTLPNSIISEGSDKYSFYMIKNNTLWYNHNNANESEFSNSYLIIDSGQLAQAKFDVELKELLNETDSTNTR